MERERAISRLHTILSVNIGVKNERWMDVVANIYRTKRANERARLLISSYHARGILAFNVCTHLSAWCCFWCSMCILSQMEEICSKNFKIDNILGIFSFWFRFFCISSHHRTHYIRYILLCAATLVLAISIHFRSFNLSRAHSLACSLVNVDVYCYTQIEKWALCGGYAVCASGQANEQMNDWAGEQISKKKNSKRERETRVGELPRFNSCRFVKFCALSFSFKNLPLALRYLASEMKNKTHNEENIWNKKEKKFGYTQRKWSASSSSSSSINSAMEQRWWRAKPSRKKAATLSSAIHKKKISWKSNKKKHQEHIQHCKWLKMKLEITKSEREREEGKKKENDTTKERKEINAHIAISFCPEPFARI